MLVPRPETETTAEVAIGELTGPGARRGAAIGVDRHDHGVHGCRPGDGSGALALALATELPDAEVWATDRSPAALAVARANLAGVGSAAHESASRKATGSTRSPTTLRGTLDLIVSNPPYVAETEVADLPPEVVDHEPHDALVSGPTGLEAIEAIVTQAPQWLAGDGALVVELDPRRADAAQQLALDAGFDGARVERDLTGRERVLVAHRS